MMPDNTAMTIGSLGEPDTAILIALNRFGYMTAAQASRLLYPNLNDQNRYATRRLKRLVDAGFLLRLRNLEKPYYGSPPHVFSLAQPGRKYLTMLGIETPEYYRPKEHATKAWNTHFMPHTLAVIDVLVAAVLLCKRYPVALLALRNERELKRLPVKVEVTPVFNSPYNTPRKVAVIPDGWFQLSVNGESPVSVALELDRGTEEQKFWRRKVAVLIAWVDGPYAEAFETDNVTIAVVTPSEARRDQLRMWTAREIALRGLSAEYEDLFLFTSADPVTIPPGSFFFDPLWYVPRHEQPLALLDRPQMADNLHLLSMQYQVAGS